jgi:hypothetical protein
MSEKYRRIVLATAIILETAVDRYVEVVTT